ncbi:MAG: hypothetical protein WA160_15205 [Pseudobdellovibrio sp.]
MGKSNAFLILFLAIGLCFFSCSKNNGTSTGNPLVSLNMTGSSQTAIASSNKIRKTIWNWFIETASAFSPPASVLDSTNLNVSLNEFWISISEIELKYDQTAQSGEVDGDSVEFAGPYSVNLFSNSPIVIATGYLPQNLIRRIKYKTKNISALSSGEPSGMINFNLYLSGSVNGNNFVFKSGEQLVIETAGPNLVTLNSGDHLLLQIQTADLIRKINLSTVTNNSIISEGNRLPIANPCPLIDSSAVDVYTCFIKGLAKQTKVGKDNGDNSFGAGDETIN